MTERRRFATSLLLCAVLGSGVASAEGATGTSEPRLVTALGRAEIEAGPDRAVVLLTVRAPGKSASEAAKAGAARSAQVLDALRGKLGPGDRAETAGASVQPVTVWDQGKPPRITGYSAEHRLRAVTSRVQDVGVLLDAVTASADVSIDSVGFELADPGIARANALRLAARDARVRAAAVAEGLGGTLGTVRAAREMGAAAPMPRGDFRMKTAMADASAPTQLVPPQLEIVGEVEVSFELVPGAHP